MRHLQGRCYSKLGRKIVITMMKNNLSFSQAKSWRCLPQQKSEVLPLTVKGWSRQGTELLEGAGLADRTKIPKVWISIYYSNLISMIDTSWENAKSSPPTSSKEILLRPSLVLTPKMNGNRQAKPAQILMMMQTGTLNQTIAFMTQKKVT